MKFTLLNNPLTWFLGLLLTLLLLNLVTKKKHREGLPENIVVGKEAATQQELQKYDSLTIIATDEYKRGAIRRWLHGKGYRKAWATPVKVPVLMLDTLYGGLIPVKKGGGFQTLSMDLVDTAGYIYTLRSVNKNPTELVPKFAWKLGIENIITDGISAAHPYGALAVLGMSEAASIPHAHPRMGYVPHQEALGEFDKDFGGKLFFLEYEPEGEKVDWTNIEGAIKLIDTDDLKELMEASNHHSIDQDALIKARLFDMLIGDWDRHEGQWGWAAVPKGADTLYIPVPCDRDNVFYGISGVLPWIISRPFFESRLRPFRSNIDYLPGLTDNSKEVDLYFLKNAPLSSFEAAAKSLQLSLTDEVIESSIRRLPKDIYELDGPEWIANLKSRREKLEKYGKKFHKVIQKRKKKPLP